MLPSSRRLRMGCTASRKISLKTCAAFSCGRSAGILIRRRLRFASKELQFRHFCRSASSSSRSWSSSVRKSRVNVWLSMSVNRIHSLLFSLALVGFVCWRCYSSRTLLYGCLGMVGHAARAPRKPWSWPWFLGLALAIIILTEDA